MKKRARVIALLGFLAGTIGRIHAQVMLTQNDFYPVYTADYPFSFLNQWNKDYEKGLSDQKIAERISLTATPFGQRATNGRNQVLGSVPCGDIYGRWDMVGLTYGPVPAGQTQAPLLTAASTKTYQNGQPLSYQEYADPNHFLGSFSIPLSYRKMGIRFVANARIFEDLIAQIEGGVSSIRQSPTYPFTNMGNVGLNQTPPNGYNALTIYGSNNPPGVTDTTCAVDLGTINNALMDNAAEIFEQMNFDVSPYSATSVEDLALGLIWRHNLYINDPSKRDPDKKYDYEYKNPDEWAKFVFTPFIKLIGVIPMAKQENPQQAFSIPSGNNGHGALCFSGGFSLDFYDTVEIALEAGAANFFKRTISGVYVPTDEKQTGIFPYATDIVSKPGKTWFFDWAFYTHHFLDKLSFYMQYIIAQHSRDAISLVNPNSDYIPELLENLTSWSIQAANFGLTYDLAPHMTVGLVWQAPIVRRGAYKVNTLAFSVIGTF